MARALTGGAAVTIHWRTQPRTEDIRAQQFVPAGGVGCDGDQGEGEEVEEETADDGRDGIQGGVGLPVPVRDRNQTHRQSGKIRSLACTNV